MTAEVLAECQGSGGYVFTYEGPQFGAQLIEEPCEGCDGFHVRASDEYRPEVTVRSVALTIRAIALATAAVGAYLFVVCVAISRSL